MSQNHLLNRNGVFYYRRRVPVSLVEKVGKKVILFSLGTSDLKEAKKRRALEDLKSDAQFEAAAGEPGVQVTLKPSQMPSQGALMQLIQDYVEKTDESAKDRLSNDPPESMDQKAEIKTDLEIGLGILKNLDDPRCAQTVHAVGTKILQEAGQTLEAVPYDFFTEAVRRSLLELQNRQHARINDDYGHAYFDQTFDPIGC